MSYRSDLRAMAAAALAALVPQGRVFQAPVWPQPASSVPAVLVSTAVEHKESYGKGAVAFRVTTQLTVQLQLAAADAVQTEAAIEALADAAENALLTDEAFMASIEQVASLETQLEVTAQAKGFIGMAVLQLACEGYWEPVVPPSVPLAGITLEPPAGETGPTLHVTILQS